MSSSSSNDDEICKTTVKKSSTNDKKAKQEQKSRKSRSDPKDESKSKSQKHSNQDEDDDDQKVESDMTKTQKHTKSKQSNKSDNHKSETNDDNDDSDKEYDDSGYVFCCSDYNSDEDSEEEEEDYESDDDDDAPDSVNRTHSHHAQHHHLKDGHRTKSSNNISKSISAPSKSTSCDSDIPTDPTNEKGRKRIAKKTLQIITYGPNMGKYTVRRRNGSIEYVNIGKQISNSYKHTETIPPNRYDDYQYKPSPHIHHHGKMCKFEVLPTATFGAAKTLVQKDHLRTCVLNYASATKPGGGFLNGRQAQEESLSRQSALYVTIMNSDMYKYNRKIKDDDFYNDFMIYSSRVPVFRSSYRERLFGKREVFEASVITSAAPNLHNINKKGAFLKALSLWWNQYETRLKNRCRKILLLAIEKGNEAIVLGAYGCGVFENSPEKISKIYKELLVDEGLGKYFVKVVFAIIDKKSNNYKAFYREFKKVK